MNTNTRSFLSRRPMLGLSSLCAGAMALLIGLPSQPPADTQVEFSTASSSVLENGTQALIPVQLSLVHGTDIALSFSLSGSAVDGQGYTIASNPIVIQAGQTSTDIVVNLLDNSLFENDDTLIIDLIAPSNIDLGAVSQHTLTIQDDDAQPLISFNQAQAKAKETSGQVQVGLNLSAIAGIDVTATLLLGGSSVTPDDFTASGLSVVIPAGQTEAMASINIVDDSEGEGKESITLVITNPIGASLGAIAATTLRVVDNDPLPIGGIVPVPPRLELLPSSLEFGLTRIGETSSAKQVVLINNSQTRIRVTKALIATFDSADFTVTPQQALPVQLPPGQSTVLDVEFTPTERGTRESFLYVNQQPHPAGRLQVPLVGEAIGDTGEELFINSGGTPYATLAGDTYSADYGFGSSTLAINTRKTVTGTDDPNLYQTARLGPVLQYDFELPNGFYDVTIHMAELSTFAPGERIFDIILEGITYTDGLDLFAEHGAFVATQREHRVMVSDGNLNVFLHREIGQALVSAIEVRSVGVLEVTPTNLDFGIIDEGQSSTLNLLLENTGLHTLNIGTLRLQNYAGDSQDLSLELNGQTYVGNTFNTVYPVDETLTAGQSLVVPVTYAPVEHSSNSIAVTFDGDFDQAAALIAAVSGFGGDPYLHPVLTLSDYSVDYNGSGTASVLLDGAGSHTHEPGQLLSEWEWTSGGQIISTQEVDVIDFPIGQHNVELTIRDDGTPQRVLADGGGFEVVPKESVPGILTLYYLADDPAPTPNDLLDSVPANPDFAEVLGDYLATNQSGSVNGSGLPNNLMVRMLGTIEVSALEPWDLTVNGGLAHRLEFDGVAVTGTLNPGVGLHTVELRVAVDDLSQLPIQLDLSRNGGASEPLSNMVLTHDLTSTAPVINSLPDEGSVLGGNQITMTGFGFFPDDQVTVNWGATTLTVADFTSWSAERIEFLSPPNAAGMISVTVQTPEGLSNPVSFEYQDDGPVPISFIPKGFVTVSQPTAARWGPDGRLYVITRPGNLAAISFDDDYNAISTDTYPGVSGLSNHDAMGLAFNPWDPADPVTVYVAHSDMYAQGGLAFTGPAPYPGQVSTLTGPDFDTPVPVVTQLPTSNHDHGINGMMFDHNGDLLITVGGNTNAGIKAPLIGDLPESPFSGAIIKAELSNPSFTGAISYVETLTGTPNDDQVFGEVVDAIGVPLLSIHATGIRNAFDLVITLRGLLYATDNGPNAGFGPASTGPDSQAAGSEPDTPDEINLIEFGHYYGHANRARGRTNQIENIYYPPSDPAVAFLTQPLATLFSSMNGIVEYRSTTFGGQMLGELLTQKFGSRIWRVTLGSDGRSVTNSQQMPFFTNSLNVLAGPGGTLLTTDYQINRIRMFVPSDQSVGSSMTPYEITPWRAPRNGGGFTSFVIGGENFGALGDTTVRIGNVNCFLTSVTTRRIKGFVPAYGIMTTDLQDVEVTSNGEMVVLTDAFRWLDTVPGQESGVWETHPAMPFPAGEVAGGIIDGTLYVVGESTSRTQSYDLVDSNNGWDETLAERPFIGHHHSAETFGRRLYLIGGLTGGSEGKMQAYDTLADAWNVGPDMPWAAGSVCSARIDDNLYVGGGIVGSTTVDNFAVFNITDGLWTTLASMPTGMGRNHAATATDGERIYVFGGRGVGSGDGNFVANGFDDVQIYDPLTDTWTTSADGGSTIPPMPIGRGGTGKAVFYRDEFYVMGGETLSGPGATGGNVYDRVDVYDPIGQTWRQETDMPTGRHGIFPMHYNGKIYVAGGGTVAGFSSSDAFEVFSRQ